MNKIRFFNYFHNGDIHVSRELVKIIMNKVKQIDHKAEFSYAHVNDPCLLADIDGLEYVDLKSLKHLKIDQYDNLIEREGITYINTWFAQQHHKYMSTYAISLDCLYAALNDTCKELWQFSIEDVSPNPNCWIPTIDYSKFEISKIDEWLAKNPQKKVFMANGHAQSGQASNFSMTPIAIELAKEYKDTIFILSSIESPGAILPNNVIYSKDIIQKEKGSDLNENSYLTNFCYLVIGRASGVFSYAWTQANAERDAKFIAFCNAGVVSYKGYPFWTHDILHDRITYKSQWIDNPSGGTDDITRIIKSHLI